MCLAFPEIHVWQSWVEIEHYSVAYFDCISALKPSSVEFLLRVGLICAWYTHEYTPHLHSVYEPHPQQKFHARALGT